MLIRSYYIYADTVKSIVHWASSLMKPEIRGELIYKINICNSNKVL
jgi:hypothetical protein